MIKDSSRIEREGLLEFPLAAPYPEIATGADFTTFAENSSKYIERHYHPLEQQDALIQQNAALLGFAQSLWLVPSLFLVVEALFKADPPRSSEAVIEEWLKIFITNSTACIALLDENLSYVSISKNWQKTFLPSSQQSFLEGKSIESTIPYASPQFREMLKNLDPTKSIELMQDYWASPTDPLGPRQCYHWTAHPWHRRPGVLGGYLFIVEDLTFLNKLELKIEELGKLNTELETAVYIGPHDLQSHLRTITSFVTLIEEENLGNPNPNIQSYLKFINQGVSRMKDLTADVLHYAQLNSEALERTDINLNALIEDMKEVLHSTIVQKKAQIIHQDLPVISGDVKLIRQVFQNILDNALKFSEIPVIHISAEPHLDGWKIAIQDNGIGIDKDHLSSVFGLFERSANTDQHLGTGIGVTFAKKVVDLHKGNIWIDSEKGKGTTVFLYFPNRLLDS